MTTVKLMQMGPLNQDLNIKHVKNIANKSQGKQKRFQFSVGMRVDSIGAPNKEGQYQFEHLSKILLERRSENGVDVLIGIVDEAIYDELYSGIDEENKCILISIKNIVGMLELSRKSFEDYVLCEVAAQLLALTFRRKSNDGYLPEERGLPWHDETKSCLFDYDENRDQTYKKLISPQLCLSCKALFAKNNISERDQEACINILRAGAKPYRTAINNTLKKRYIMMPLGIIIGGVITRYQIDPSFAHILVGEIVFLISFLLLFFYSMYREIKRLDIKLYQ